MIPTLFFLRHGQTIDDLPGKEKHSGWNGVGLDKAGIAAAHAAADFLAQFPIQEVVCSDLNRTQQTAAIVGAKLNVPVKPEFKLRCWNMGNIVGLPVTEGTPKLEAAVKQPHVELPGGESFYSFYSRWAGYLDECFHEIRRDPAPIVLVTHSQNLYAINSILSRGHLPIQWEGQPHPGSVAAIRLMGPKVDYKVLFESKN